MPFRFAFSVLTLAWVFAGPFPAGPVPAAHAEDWPAYRRDAVRSAVSGESLRFPMSPRWTYRTAQGPRPAWPEPGRALNTLDFDYAFQPVVAGGVVYFGSSGDDAVRAVDAETGRLIWSFVTGGPIRFAPHVDSGKLYVASDDGRIYCLDARHGQEIWQFRGGLDARHFIAQGRLTSRWPARSGVLVRDRIAYVTMGMWPSEGVFLYALDAATGRQIWCNDTDYADYIEYPHAPSVAFGGPAPQGYLLAHKEVLVVPTGRSAPAGYNIQNGKQLYYNAAEANRGGTYVIVGDDRVFASTVAWQPDQSVRQGESPAHRADSLAAIHFATGREEWPFTRSIKATTDQVRGARWRSEIGAGIYGRQHAIFSGQRLYTMGNGKVDAFELQGEVAKLIWSFDQPRVYSEALADGSLLLGQAGALVALDPATGEQLWRAEVDGQVRGLAISDGRIVASNERGEVFCFAPPDNQPAVVVDEAASQPADKPARGTARESAAEVLTKVPQARQIPGFALVVGEPNARLAQTLAEQTQLHVVSVLEDPAKVQSERQRLLATNLYGARISVLAVDTDRREPRLPLLPYFANLVVVSGETNLPGDELYRVLRPCGGVMAFVNGASKAALAGADVPDREFHSGVVVRGKLPGAFDWDSENKVDLRVRWPLEFQWFGEPGAQLVMPRHARPPTPLAANGRMFVFGEYHVSAVDAYNGTLLWRRRLNPQTVGAQGNPFADDDYLYLRQGRTVAQFDAANGTLAYVYNDNGGPPVHDATTPIKLDSVARDGYSGTIEVDGTGSHLTITLTTRAPSPSRDDVWELAFDFRTPRQRLQASGPGTFELIVQPWSATFRKQPTFDHPDVSIERVGVEPEVSEERVSDDGRVSVVRLSVPWSKVEELVGWRPTSFALAADLKLWQEDFRLAHWARPLVSDKYFFNNAEAILAVAPEALNMTAGPKLLSRWMPVPTRNALAAHVGDEGALPLMVTRIDGNKDMRDETGNPWHSTPRAQGFELTYRQSPLTLDTGWRDYSRSYGCSGFSCSATTDFFRSGTIGVYDREDDSGMRNISGIRSGCGLTLVPALGMLLYSESAADCLCGYSFATSLAMAPVEHRRHEDWALFHQRDLTPGQVRQSALNLGAPGDRRDEDAILWLGYPRPALAVQGGYTFDLPYRVELFLEFGPRRVNSDRTRIEQTERPWIYASQLHGLSKISMDMMYYQPRKVLVSLAGGQQPEIDGNLSDECWNGFGAVPSLDGRGAYYFRHDSQNLYVGYEQKSDRDRRGNPTAWKASVTDRDGRIDRDDHIRLAFGNLAGTTIMTLGASATGGVFDSLLDFAADVPALSNVKIDGKIGDWKSDAPLRGTHVKLAGDAELQTGWNQQGLLMLARVPKTFNGGDGAGMGGMTFLLGRDGSTTMQQLTIDVAATAIHTHGWNGEQSVDAAINAVAAESGDDLIVEAMVPWSSLDMTGESGETVRVAIRYYNPRESFFSERRPVPFDSPRERASEFRRDRGLTLRLSAGESGSVLDTDRRRNHYGYVAYDIVARAADRTTWDGAWTAKVKTDEDCFRAELAVPWTMLEDAGLERGRLQIDLHKPLIVSDAQDRVLPSFQRQSILIHTAEQPPSARYTVRLHFAELDDVAPGERVFDVMLQDQVVLENLDVVCEAGGRYRALVKEFSDIRADRLMELRLVPKSDKLDARAVPILNGLELVQ